MKRTPDTTTRIKVGADGKDIDPQGVEWVINPYDEFAIEEAIRIRERLDPAWWDEEIKRAKDRRAKGELSAEQVAALEKDRKHWEGLMPVYGKVTITAVSVDPEANQTVQRKVLAMGVDQGILIHGGGNYDGFSTASLLADALRGLKADLILFGKQAIDDDGYQVPSMVAHLLGLPRANVVTKLEFGPRRVTARRQIEGGEEVVELALPCVLSCQRGLNEPRYPSLKGIMASKKKPLEVRKASAPAARLAVERMEPPPPRPAGRIVADVRGKSKEEIREACRELLRVLREEAKVL